MFEVCVRCFDRYVCVFGVCGGCFDRYVVSLPSMVGGMTGDVGRVGACTKIRPRML